MDHTLQEWVRLAQGSDLAQAAIDAQAHETRRTSTEVFRIGTTCRRPFRRVCSLTCVLFPV